MPRAITLFEHEAVPFAWADHHLARFERLRAAVGADVLRPTVLRGHHFLQATQFVGVVRLGNDTIQILPKIYRFDTIDDQRARERAATRNLLYMLSYAGQIDIKEREVTTLLQHDSNWFEILTRLFATHLAEEWQRGPTRGYQVIEDDVTALKGMWRIHQQIRRPERHHLFTVTYDEFTVDNQLNRVLRFVVECLWRQTRDSGNRRVLSELRHWMEDVALLPVVHVTDAPAALVTRLNQRYRPLLNLARLFLGAGAIQFGIGDADHYALLFDMNLLFEAFIAGFIGRHRDRVLPMTLQSCDLLTQTRGATRYLARANGVGVFLLKPDLSFRQGTTFSLLLDTKYKPLQTEMRHLGVSQADVYQMFAYAHRYDCGNVLLLYPQTARMATPIRQQFQLEGTISRKLAVATIDVRVDLGRTDDCACLVTELHDILCQETAEWPQQ